MLYTSNGNLCLNSANIGDGDTITVLSTGPALKPVEFMKTGSAQTRAMASFDDEDQYLAACLVSGGVKVYERVSAEQGWLKEVASLNDTRICKPSVFIFV